MDRGEQLAEHLQVSIQTMDAPSKVVVIAHGPSGQTYRIIEYWQTDGTLFIAIEPDAK